MLKKPFIFLLIWSIHLSGISFANPQELERKQEKSKTLAVTLSIIPSLGHAYVDQWWPRGAKYLLMQSIGGLLLADGINDRSNFSLSLGILFLSSKLWEFYDVFNATDEYNLSLLKEASLKLSEQKRMTEINRIEWLDEYVKAKKNYLTGFVLSLLPPPIGHTYAGNWTRGLWYLGAEVSGLGLIVWGLGFQTAKHAPDFIVKNITSGPDILDTVDTRADQKGGGSFLLAFTGMLLLFGGKIAEIVDVADEIHQYNSKLKKDIYLQKQKQQKISFNFFEPKTSQFGLYLKYHF